MAFQEPVGAFFPDFGVAATVGDFSDLVIFNSPDIDALSGRVTSTHYEMTFRTASFPTLAYGDQVRIDGYLYNVQAVNKIGDGVMTNAILQRVQ